MDIDLRFGCVNFVIHISLTFLVKSTDRNDGIREIYKKRSYIPYSTKL